jgi:two-component system, cell cycle sensor histidine kinase and response regulator CckA
MTRRRAASGAPPRSSAPWRFEEAFESSPIGMALVAPDGRWLHVNRSLCRIVGYSREELLANDFQGITHPADLEASVTVARRLLAGEISSCEFEKRYLHREGHVVPVRLTVSMVRGEKGEPLYFVSQMQDITERELAAEALRTSEDRYRDLVEHSGDLMGVHDLDGRILSINEVVARMTGYTLAELHRMNIRDLLVSEIRHQFDAYLAEVRAQGRARGIMKVRTRADEIRIWEYDNTLRTEGVASPAVRAFARDVTERHRAERLLRASEARYRQLFDANPQPMWVYDVETLRFLEVNEAAVARYGWSRAELLEMRLTDIRPPEEVPRLLENLAQAPPTIENAGTWKHRTKDGKILDVEIASHAIEFGGRPARLVLANDVTERRRLEERFLQAQKMEIVGRLAGGIAHDFNNLLTVINGTAELAAAKLAEKAPLRTELLEILRAGERAAGLTRQLLAFSRQQVLLPEALDLGTLLRGLQPMLARLLGEDILLEIEAAHGAYVRADPGQLEQVILNLAVNARDAMSDGGRLAIRAHCVGTAATEAACSEPQVELEVSDTGDGMNAEVRARIFEPFFTTKGPGKGTGLGLSTVLGIVEQSGGSIEVESTPGEGTAVRIRLPGLLEAPSANDGGRADAAGGGSETILVVEDEPALRTLTERILAAAGYRVLAASGGEEAIRALGAAAAGVDLVLTDVVMPGMSGAELARRIGERAPGTAILFTSGYTDDEILRHGVLADAAQFLPKPYSRADLLARVRERLDARR